MENLYAIYHVYDVDGGSGDAVPTETCLGIIEGEEEAKAYVAKYSKPKVYAVPYSKLYHHELYYRPITRLDISKSPFGDEKEDEYQSQYRILLEKYRATNSGDIKELLTKMQYAYMEDFLAKLDEDSKVYELFYELTYRSSTGQAVVTFASEDEANDFDIMVWKNYGDMALDSEVYEDDGEWIVDYMFGGMYCPSWDGIDDNER